MFQNFSILDVLLRLPGILLGFTFHEYAHAYMATRFGDPTPNMDGRLTANPFAHVDIWGFLLILVAGFGWAKPVRTNPSYYRGDIRKKDILVSFAGPAANLMIAFAAGLVYILLYNLGIFYRINSSTADIVMGILSEAIWINCVLFIFNLVPIPPLDGFHIILDLIPQISYRFAYTMERYGYIVLILFIMSGLSDIVVGGGASLVFNSIRRIILTLRVI